MVKNQIKSEIIPTLIYLIVSTVYLYSQSSQIISLWDFTNYTDLAVRILNGQIPYLDIPLYTQPGTFVELALFLSIFGKNIYAVYFVILAKQVLIGFMLSSLISQFFKNTIFDKLAIKVVWLVLFALLSPWSVVPQNTYDADLAFAVLLAIYILIKFDNISLQNRYFNLFTNLVFVLFIAYYPFFFKQTSGLVWLVFIHIYLFIAFFVYKSRMLRYLLLLDLILGSFILFLQIKTSFVTKWWLWAIEMPIKNRYTANMTPLAQLERVLQYKNIFILVALISIFLIIILRKYNINKSYFIFMLTSLLIVTGNFITKSEIRGDIFKIDWDLLMIPTIFLFLVISFVFNILIRNPLKLKLIIAATILTLSANYLSQGILGSSYGFFQLYLLINLFLLIPFVKGLTNSRLLLKLGIILAIPLIFSANIVYYSSSKIRMAYVRFDEEIERYPVLYSWIGTPGKYLEESQIGIDLFDKYIKKGRTAVWPGEDPVALFGSTIPSTQISLSDPTTNPFYNDVDSWLKEQNIEYVILKSRLHTPGMHQISIDKFEKASKNYVRIEKKGVYFVLQRK